MLNDLRYAVRTLRQSPGFALTAIVSIALGIGANSAIFSLADGLLLRPLPVADASRVMTLRSRSPSGTFGEMSYPDFADIRDKSQSFDGLVAYQVAPCGIAADSRAQSQLRFGYQVSGNFFHVLGVEPQLGRGFKPDEDKAPGRDAVIILGYDYWKGDFAGDPSVVGRHIRVNGVDFMIIGVAPESFTGLDQFIRPAFFIPAMMGPAIYSRDLLTSRGDRGWQVKGRLKQGVAVLAADAEVSGLAKSLEQAYASTDRGFGTVLRSEFQTRLDKSPGNTVVLGLLFPSVIVALLIACANVANLTLSHGQSRAREVAVRLAIGASRAKLIRQLMAESLLIALAGGALGLLMAQFAVAAFASAQIPSDIPIQISFQLDQRVLWFTAFIACACALLFGLAPALQSTRTELVPVLKAGELAPHRHRWFSRNALVTLQIAGSLVLLIAATQIYRGFCYLIARGPGFQTDHLIVMSVDPTLIRYKPEQMEQLYKTLSERSRLIPGIKSSALSYSLPLSTMQQEYEEVVPEGFQLRAGQNSLTVQANTVDQYYFETFGVPILRGRPFLATDRAESPRVAVVNEALARRYFGQDPIGKRFRIQGPNGPWVEIVGVAATGKYNAMFEPPTGFLYLPLTQRPQIHMTLIAQSEGDPAALAVPLRELAHSIDPNLPIFGIRTVSDFFEQGSVALLRRMEEVVGSAGLLGLALALIGIYAVVAYQVARRTREIGIRMAIGADSRQVMRMILMQAGALGVAGVGLGAVLSVAAGRALAASAIGVPAFNFALFNSVTAGVLLVTLLAAAIPARRAARIDPIRALRED
ncbi:MAG: ABC transporter permease [Bryobacteraceae bacterium]|jgi:putative ABC transport system permease protein